MKQKKTILVVDDDESISMLLIASLSNKYNAIAVNSGKAALTYCKKEKPSAILLDINLGDIDGRDVCKMLQKIYKSQPPPIIFISGDDSENSIISCFEHGADDFIGKPFSAKQVVGKIDALLRYDMMINNLKSQSDELSELVHTSMSQASSYGSVLQVVKNLNNCDSEQEMADLIFGYLKSQGLTCCIYFVNTYSSCCFDQKARICPPIIKEVFELAHNRQRLHKLGSRLMTSDNHCSILIMNPPDEEFEEYGVFIDIVAVLIEALEARYLAFLREQELRTLHTELSDVIHELKDSVEDVRAKKQKLIDDIVLQIGLSFHELDLSEAQEVFFTNMLEKTVLTHGDNNTVITALQSRLTNLVEHITELVKPKKLNMVEHKEEDIELF